MNIKTLMTSRIKIAANLLFNSQKLLRLFSIYFDNITSLEFKQM